MSLPNSTSSPPDLQSRQPCSLGVQLWRALRLRCPLCGQGKLFRGWFRMHETCPQCHFRFERSPGYWLGSIFVNYGLTALIVTGAYFAFFFSEILPEEWVMRLLLAFCLLFPLWFFRYARSIWIGIDMYFDPEPPGSISPPSRLIETNNR